MTTTVLLALFKKLEGKVDSLELIRFEPVTELPETGEPNIIYLVPKSDPETGNYSDEYIWDSDNQTYEKIGDTQVNPTPVYYKFESYTFALDKYYRLLDGKTQHDVFSDCANGKDVILIWTNSGSVGSFKYFYTLGPGRNDASAYNFIYFEATDDRIIFNGGNLQIRDSVNNYARLTLFQNAHGIGGSCFANAYKKHFLGIDNNGTGVETRLSPYDSIAFAYDNTATYAVGDLCIYNDILYECTTAITVAEAWTAAHWTAKTVADELAVKANISDIPTDANHNIASAYDSTASYAVGDLCIYDGNLYECSTAISTAEEWTAAHWTQKTVAQELAIAGGNDIEIFEGTIQNKKINLLNNKKVEDIFKAVNNGKRVILKAGNCVFYNTLNNDGYTLGFASLSAISPNSSSYSMYIYYAECYGYSSGLQRTYIDLISPNNTTGYSSIQKIFLQPSNGNYRYYGYSTDINGVAILVKDRSRLIANIYDLTVTYNSGDLAIDRTSMELYRCNTDNTTGAWDSTKWDQVTVEDLLNAIPALPTVTSSDEGKVAMVDSNGNWVAGYIPDGSNTSY